MWMVAPAAPDEFDEPSQLAAAALPWREVAGVVDEEDADARDWWYRRTFDHAPGPATLHFGGLATLAQVWLNGERVLESRNMFVAHDVDVVLRERNELVLCVRSLDAELAKKRPRPRWKPRLVAHQNLRWLRTSLLGRMPGWPRTPLVGLWREFAITDGVLRDASVVTRVDGTVLFDARGDVDGTLHVGDVSAPLQRVNGRVTAELRVEHPRLWWPHTHGEPALYDCSVRLAGRTLALPRLGFRSIDFDDALRVNGERVFCRGACWTPVPDGEVAATLRLLRDAGANMVRIGGTMTYESDAFYALCDELGLLVWQDFMFANMDYPAADAELAASVETEARQQLRRLRAHPSVAVWCGNSEVEQQAAMLGLPRELWRNALFGELLPALCRELHPDAAYVPSTPSGGALPFHTNEGVAHYYGVGAYLRPLSDARRAAVRFAAECLGFANVGTGEGDPLANAPRDPGASLDFGDVRDHYARELFGAAEPSLDLRRVVTGEVMAQVFAEWRRAGSTCGGGLVWYLRDLVPGAGWGVIDSRGAPKPAFRYLARAWQPRTIALTDEGLNGVALHVINESPEPLRGVVELVLLRDGQVPIARGEAACEVPPRGAQSFDSDALLGAFYDVAYAYRFGPPSHDVVVATLRDAGGAVLAEAFHFPLRREPLPAGEVRATATRVGGDDWELSVESDRFLFGAHVDLADAVASDDWCHVVPGRPKRLRLHGAAGDGFVAAVNLAERVRITVTG